MKIAIITGISGQDGAYLAQLLLSKGYKVVGLTRKNRQKPLSGLNFLGVLESCEIKEIDLFNKSEVDELIQNYQPHEFYNLAAQSSVGYSFETPTETFSFNTLSVLNILEAIRLYSRETKFYQASSSEMFGDIGAKFLPLKETFLFHPVSPYGISKASAHWLTINYREAYGLHTCCGILFNHESCLRGDNFVIKKIIQGAIRIKNKEQSHLKLGNLSVQRDWGYAPKFAEAMWLMLQKENPNEYLICSGQVVKLSSLVQKVFEKLDLDFHEHVIVDSVLMRKLDLEIIYGDNSKAKKELGWDYDFTLNQLIETLIADEIKYLAWQKESTVI